MKYWMFFRQFAIASVATGLLAGCNKEPLEAGTDAGERVEIVSGIALPSPSVTADTKAPVSHIDDLQGKTLYFMRGDGYSLIQGVLYMSGSFGTQIIEAMWAIRMPKSKTADGCVSVRRNTMTSMSIKTLSCAVGILKPSF
ncbi:hypothetical protein [Rikenella microfusus]|uniref:hypothetical protein n=1 Tax=Rikenella microfusus TaxID=28139 RepID=UPI003AB3C1D1